MGAPLPVDRAICRRQENGYLTAPLPGTQVPGGDSGQRPERMRTMRYQVKLRSGMVRDYPTKREAMAAYRSEIRDGWPSSVTNLTTGTRIA